MNDTVTQTEYEVIAALAAARDSKAGQQVKQDTLIAFLIRFLNTTDNMVTCEHLFPKDRSHSSIVGAFDRARKAAKLNTKVGVVATAGHVYISRTTPIVTEDVVTEDVNVDPTEDDGVIITK